MSTLITVVSAIVVFGLVIFIHEFGHFITAKKFNVKVNEFAIGMGPVLFSFTKGETLYRLRLLPIGGFVAMEGEDEDSNDPRAYNKLPKIKKAIILLAGAFMNLLLGFIILIIIVSNNDYIASRTVSGIAEGSLVGQDGLMVGDVITAVNGRRVFIANDVIYELVRTENYTADITVNRDGESLLLEGVRFDTIEHEGGHVQLVQGFTVLPVEKTIISVASEAVAYTASLARIIFLSLVDLVTGRVAINNLSGPVGIVTVIGDAAALGIIELLMVVALLTVNLGVFNLLPVPALDGGRLFFLVVEAIIRRPIPQKFEIVVNGASFMLLMGLMVFVTFNDVSRLIG